MRSACWASPRRSRCRTGLGHEGRLGGGAGLARPRGRARRRSWTGLGHEGGLGGGAGPSSPPTRGAQITSSHGCCVIGLRNPVCSSQKDKSGTARRATGSGRAPRHLLWCPGNKSGRGGSGRPPGTASSVIRCPLVSTTQRLGRRARSGRPRCRIRAVCRPGRNDPGRWCRVVGTGRWCRVGAPAAGAGSGHRPRVPGRGGSAGRSLGGLSGPGHGHSRAIGRWRRRSRKRARPVRAPGGGRSRAIGWWRRRSRGRSSPGSFRRARRWRFGQPGCRAWSGRPGRTRRRLGACPSECR